MKAESDDEGNRKKRSKKVKVEGEVASGDENGEVKKKRRPKAKKEANGNGVNAQLDETQGVPTPEEDDAVFSGPEDDKPKKVRLHRLVSFHYSLDLAST